MIITALAAFVFGNVMKKLRLPAILGWLIAGMVFGPHALGILSQSIMDATWYKTMMSIFEVGLGCLLGT